MMSTDRGVTECETQHPRAAPGGDILELLVLSGSEIDPAAQARYETLAAEAIVWACSVGARLEIRPIDGLSFEEPAVFSGAAPSPSDNPFVDGDKRRRFFDETLAGVKSLYALKGAPRADFFGGLRLAAKITKAEAPPARLTIVIVGHGWQQVPDLYDSKTHPQNYARSFIAARRAHDEMPDLRNARVFIVGISSGPAAMGKKGDLESLCAKFWSPVIHAANGTWSDCWPELPPTFRT
jgi:hypothetical protein